MVRCVLIGDFMFLCIYELMQFVLIVSISLEWLFYSGAILHPGQALRMKQGAYNLLV